MPEAYRVGIGGIAIESSTFSPLPTTLADFTVLRGEALLDRYRFAGDEVAWQPCLYARSIPGGPLTPQTYQTLVITSRRKPFHFVRDFTNLGLDPADNDVVVVKIGYLEPELAHIAKCALLALTPGAVNQDIRSLKYTRVHRPIFPLDDDMQDPELTVRVF